jgi:hypothetical protein
MSHRATFYTVRVKRKWKKDGFCRLGEFDGQGHSVSEFIQKCLETNFTVISDDGEKLVTCLSASMTKGPENDEISAALIHARTGETADIHNKTGKRQYQQKFDDTHRIKCMCLFVLARGQTIGWLTAQVNSGRSAKGLMATHLETKFKEYFPEYTLEFTPFIEQAALIQALEEGHMDRVKLVRLERPNDRSVAALDRWVYKGRKAKIEVDIRPAERGGRLIATDVKRFMKGERNGYEKLLEFQGIKFDEAKVEVELANGQKRTFNILHPDAGHAFSVDLVLPPTDPPDEEVEKALRDALSEFV